MSQPTPRDDTTTGTVFHGADSHQRRMKQTHRTDTADRRRALATGQGSADAYDRRLAGRMAGMPHWSDLEALWAAMRAAPEGWYLVEAGQAVPQQPLQPAALLAQLEAVDALLRREHPQRYCGIVYADDATAPEMVKVFDPRGLGAMCGCSAEPTPARWVFSRLRPASPTSAPSASAASRRRPPSMVVVDRAVSVFAGLMVVFGLGLAHLTGRIDLARAGWLWLAAFVGVALLLRGFTGSCPAAKIVKALGPTDGPGSAGGPSAPSGASGAVAEPHAVESST